MVDSIHVNKTRIASLDLIKFIAICGVLIIHLIGKTAFGGIFWYAQAVPLFMVLMGYHCNNHINWKSLGKAYISYLILFFVSLALALYVGVPFSVHYFPIGLIPFQGPGTYWILLYFLFVFISPFLYKLRQSVSLSMFILILFLLGWSFDVVYELLSDNLVGVNYLYKIFPLRYILCFGLGMIIKEKSPQWFMKSFWLLACFSVIYLYVGNYTSIDVSYIFFDNAGWSTGENGFAAFYPAFLVALILWLFRNIRYYKFLFLGRYTYHVFLFQILWFPIVRHFIHSNILFAILTFVCCFFGGYIFYRVSNQINQLISKK